MARPKGVANGEGQNRIHYLIPRWDIKMFPCNDICKKCFYGQRLCGTNSEKTAIYFCDYLEMNPERKRRGCECTPDHCDRFLLAPKKKKAYIKKRQTNISLKRKVKNGKDK